MGVSRRGGRTGRRSIGGARTTASRLARLGALATLLYAAPSRADDTYPSIGVFLGYVFGERPSFEWGVQASWISVDGGTSDCVELGTSRTIVGSTAQVALLGLSRPRFTIGALGGQELEDTPVSFIGELGLTLRLDQGTRFGLHTGEVVEVTWPNVYGRQGWFLGEYAVGGGTSFLPMVGGDDDCPYGRPVAGRLPRDEAGLRVAPCGTPAGLSGAALAWFRDAQAECASVRAFLELARELFAVGAPLALVHRALDAAEDEIRHAEICAEVTSELAGRTLRPTLVSGPERPLLPRAALLVRLAVESFVDGCLGEGESAERARSAAASTDDPLLRAAHERIAIDEARHAELGWDIVRWALVSGGPSVRAALAECSAAHGIADDAQVAVRARSRLRRALEPSAA